MGSFPTPGRWAGTVGSPRSPSASSPRDSSRSAGSSSPHRSPPPFSRVLVANRGEVACRIAGTVRRLGGQVVAVHSDADAGAKHVREADASVRIGESPAPLSYLNPAAIVRAAVDSKAEAVHPGYGFLAES